MKLFRNKNRGPKVKSEDVIIPEAYLEYEREQEEKRRQEKREAEEKAQAEAQAKDAAQSRQIDAEIDEFKARLDSIMNNHSSENGESGGSDDDAILDEPLEIELKRSVREKNDEKQKERTETSNKKVAKQRKKRESAYTSQFKALLAGIVVAVATIVVMLGPVMNIDKVDINNNKYVSQEKVLEMAGFPVGQNLFRYNISKAEDAMLQYPYVEDVRISRHFPHRLQVDITEREPAGVLLNNGNYLQFSKDGILLDNTKSLSNLSLPLITGFKMEDVPSPGGTFKDNTRFNDILRIINACDDDLLRMLQEINIKDRSNILAYTSQGLEVRIGSIDNIESRMATLNDIINQVILSGIISEPIEAIDIRYEKSPVVVLEGYSNVNVKEFVDETEDGESIQEKNDRANRELEEGTDGASADATGA